MTEKDLIAAARAAALRAYAPYSNFSVGCAIESVDGEVVTGANLENACYRLGLCAEQSALTAAQHLFGLAKVSRIAVAGGDGSGAELAGEQSVTPCGGCRQAILEAAHLSGENIEILCASGDGETYDRHRIRDLIPHGFGPANLTDSQSKIVPVLTAAKARHNELELDHQFWDALVSNAEFETWLVSLTKFAGQNLALVRDEKWHQRWYRDPDTKKDSETDILLFFQRPELKDRVAIHIENKPAHRSWEPSQAENYLKRARHCMSKWNYTDFQTMLIAPAEFIAAHPAEVAHFDVAVPYDRLAQFIPAFRDS